jgi:hypothetical protein
MIRNVLIMTRSFAQKTTTPADRRRVTRRKGVRADQNASNDCSGRFVAFAVSSSIGIAVWKGS